MKINKAVITAAGRGARSYPVADPVEKGILPIVDVDGVTKPLLQIIAEEALDSGIDEVCVVSAPGDEDRYRQHFESLRENLLTAHKGVEWAAEEAKHIERLQSKLRFVEQAEPLGYGHAVACARDFVSDEAFLLLLGDHIYRSFVPGHRCAEELLRLAVDEQCAVAAVQATREHLIGRYGTLSGKRVAGHAGVYQIERIIEKPSLSQAELQLSTMGLRTGHYLCFFGMHVLPPTIFEILESSLDATQDANGEYQFTPALEELASREKYLALEVSGRRYDVGARYGWLQAQLALAMAGPDHDDLSTMIIELLADTGRLRDRPHDD